MSQQTSLYAAHNALKARMVPFAGWDMPVSYASGTAAEVRACRSSVGLFDVSHMGEINIRGKDAQRFLQFLTTNDVSKVSAGAAQYGMLLNPSGCVLDDIIVYCKAAEDYFVVVNAGCHEKDRDWIIAQSADFAVEIEDVSPQTALIAVQGLSAVAMVSNMTDASIANLKRFEFMAGNLAEHQVIFSRTGYTGEDGFEIFCHWDDALSIWRKLTAVGGIPCGLGARDVLRLEAAYPLYGHELDGAHTPLESGGAWAVKLGKGDFIGRDALIAQKESGTAQKLVGLKVTGGVSAIPRDGCTVLNENGGAAGVVTSGTLSPTIGSGIALARVERRMAGIGSPLIIDIRGRRIPVEVATLPFYRNGV